MEMDMMVKKLVLVKSMDNNELTYQFYSTTKLDTGKKDSGILHEI